MVLLLLGCNLMGCMSGGLGANCTPFNVLWRMKPAQEKSHRP